ncbi:MerR family transcriptional regulator [Nonomuraea jiangxiensis]|uniref:MerR HTH family regulatory protein n=1 Tax=Nonomuraea jiangxiensis TaxID=633440 RepID=A0A1G9VKJ3_9ACTN|nr:MerR family transcriptional regulator [Nonomuraea jiangxiensis]SDM72742.1 MerR HTH family regulatory protein [Nonomuraea jiangxiensis]
MRVGELSKRSGVAIATIKFYVREGLLPPGLRTKANQVDYSEAHLRRLRLVRALLDVGELSVATAKRIIAALDDPDESPLTSIGRAAYALARGFPAAVPPGADDNARVGALDLDTASVTRVNDLLDRYGWTVRPDNPARAQLASAIAAVQALDMGDALDLLDRYAQAAHSVAEVDVELALSPATLEESTERMLVWTVVGDRALSALRRLAQEAVIIKRM